MSPDDITDWTVQEDKGFLINLNLSALSFIIFPLLGIVIPLILWISKKDKIRNLNEIAKDLLNFQITWTMLLFVGYIGIAFSTVYKIKTTGDVNAAILSSRNILNLVFFVIMYSYNLILTVINSIRINNDKDTGYYPKIKFLRK